MSYAAEQKNSFDLVHCSAGTPSQSFHFPLIVSNLHAASVETDDPIIKTLPVSPSIRPLPPLPCLQYVDMGRMCSRLQGQLYFLRPYTTGEVTSRLVTTWERQIFLRFSDLQVHQNQLEALQTRTAGSVGAGGSE